MNNYILEGIIKQAANEAAVRTATMLVKSAGAEQAPATFAQVLGWLKGLGPRALESIKGQYGNLKRKGQVAYRFGRRKANKAINSGKEWVKENPKTAFGIGAGAAGLGGGGIGYALGSGDDDDEGLLEGIGGGDLDIGQLLNDNKFALGGGIGGAGLGALMGDSTSSKILGALLGGGAGAGLGYLADQNL